VGNHTPFLGGRRGCSGSCIYIKFDGRGSGRESGESVHFSTLLVNRINPQSGEKTAGSSRVNRILIMIEQRKDSNSQEGCHFQLNRARTLEESVTHNFDPKSLHLLVLWILSQLSN